VGSVSVEATLLVGPEGGFSDAERSLALAAGARPCCFGPYDMRIETAAVAGCAIVMAARG
jgi:16S rRNA (uracil1498-N3)-methyltransferase